ncbi:hypothetical protein ACWGIU_24490, partial [Streptomyces sp. NPDC054840]
MSAALVASPASRASPAPPAWRFPGDGALPGRPSPGHPAAPWPRGGVTGAVSVGGEGLEEVADLRVGQGARNIRP